MPKNGLRVINGIRTFATFAVLAFFVGSSSTIAEQSHVTGPVRLNGHRGQVTVPATKPPALGNVGAGQGMDGVQAPNSGVQQARPRSVYREIVRRVNVAGGVLALPVVAYYGVPVILDVPGLGYVDVLEDEYARLFDKFSSSDSEQVQEAMSSLQRIKAIEEAEVEAVRRGPERTEPDDVEDLSEPIFFHTPSRAETRRRGLY